MKKLQLFGIIFLLLICRNVYATWSIIAVDRNTGEIGISGASCTFDVSGIASIEPQKGAIVVQAASNYFARMEGVSLMENDASAEDIMTAMKDERFKPEKQQYGVILLTEDSKPLVYSGSEISSWSGGKVGSDLAVMGNTLVNEQVVNKAFDAFDGNRDKSLAQRLMLALKVGEESGGDNRCGAQYARSAFLMIYQPSHGAIIKLAIQGLEKGEKPAVSLLNDQFNQWYKQ